MIRASAAPAMFPGIATLAHEDKILPHTAPELPFSSIGTSDRQNVEAPGWGDLSVPCHPLFGLFMVVVAVAFSLGSSAMFTGSVMSRIAYVALAIPCLVRVEVVERLLPACGHRSGVAMSRIIAIVDVSIKAPRTVIPGARSDEHPATEPIWPIVAVGRTTIRSIVVVAVGTHRRGSNANGNLGRCCRCAAEQRNNESR